MTVIKISYANGSMIIDLEEFLSCRSIAKVRKLLKVIRCGHTPECEQQIKEFVQEWVESFEHIQQKKYMSITEYRQKVISAEKQIKCTMLEVERGKMELEIYQYLRDTHRKNTKIWKRYNEELKTQREKLKEPKSRLKEQKEELQYLKNLLRYRQSDFDKNIRNKEFYKKVLQIIT